MAKLSKEADHASQLERYYFDTLPFVTGRIEFWHWAVGHNPRLFTECYKRWVMKEDHVDVRRIADRISRQLNERSL